MDIPEQHRYLDALDAAWKHFAERPPGQLEDLGAVPVPGTEGLWELPVLNARFQIDAPGRSMTIAGRPVSVPWQILALHYLLADVPVPQITRSISFEEIPDARGYSASYAGRVITRLCTTVGADREKLLAAADAVGAVVVPGGGLSLHIQVFPRIPVTVVWYAGDDEFPPGASFLYEDNVTAMLSVEDIVVMASQVVSRLCGKDW